MARIDSERLARFEAPATLKISIDPRAEDPFGPPMGIDPDFE